LQIETKIGNTIFTVCR